MRQICVWIRKESMLIEDAFKMAQATKLVAANVAHIKNKNTKDLHKMFQVKQSSVEIEKKKRL